MKRFVSIASVLVLFLTTFANSVLSQSLSDWALLGSALKDQDYLDLQLDFSNALIDNVSSKDFLAAEKNWDQSVAEVRREFLMEFNNYAKRTPSHLRAGDFPNAPIILLIRYIDIDKHGAKILVQVIVKRREDGQALFVRECSANEGSVGTFTNLLGESMRELGSYLGRKVKNFVK